MGYEIRRVKFSNPEKGECVGKADAGTCMDCIKRNPAKMSCKKMGEFLNNHDWNKIVANGPQQVKDFKVREAIEASDYDANKQQIFDKRGKLLKVRKIA